jgi:hypothetical protein
LSVDRQGFMFGRSNICVAEPRERVTVPAECQFGRPAEKGDLLAFCLSDMRKIKTNLVTFVTDNFLLLSIVGNTDFLRAGGENGGAAHRKRKRKRRRCDNGTGNSADLRWSAKTRVGDCKYKCPTSPRRRLPRWPRGVFSCARPNPADDSGHRNGSACVSECVHRTIYGMDESHSLIGTASRSEKDQRAAGTQPLKIPACQLKQVAEVQP